MTKLAPEASPPLTLLDRQDGVPIGEAAEALGISTAAARKRIQRGTLDAYKGQDGLWYVVLPDDLDASSDTVPDHMNTVPDIGLAVVVDTLKDEVQFLRQELARRTDELRSERESRAEAERRRDILFAQFGDQLKSISHTTNNVQQQVEAVVHEVVSDSQDEVPPAAPVSWWRRLFVTPRRHEGTD